MIKRRLGWAYLGVMVLLGCNLARGTQPGEVLPTATATDHYAWQVIAAGIERRDVTIPRGEDASVQAVLVRLDPAVVTLRVHYRPGDPYGLDEWRAALPQAAVLVNGGFFDEADQALGLLVSDGQVFSQSFVGFGGMLQVTNADVQVRSLVSTPYQGELLLQAVQSFPMLLEVGGYAAPQDDGFARRSRRTVIGQDGIGRIVLMVVPQGMISFAELQQWLLTSDLQLTVALALDGGRSTGLAINVSGHRELYPMLSKVPAVIAIYAPS